MVPLAHGTDFGGSVRTPASFCDVVSIRPTPGRIAAPARALGWDMLATHGLLARTVGDLELGLSACVGPDVRDPLSIGNEPQIASDAGRLQVAVTSASHRLRRMSARASLRFAMRCRKSPMSKRSLPTVAVPSKHSARCRPRMSPTAMARCCEPSSRQLLFGTLRGGEQLTAQDYLAAERRRTAIYRSFRDLMARKDFIVMPAASVFPWNNDIGDVTRIDDMSLDTPIDYLAVTFIVSLVGFPVLTLPTPRQPDQKPFGVQIIAAPGEESKLFAFGRRIEEQLGFCHRPPPI
jgi:amidase